MFFLVVEKKCHSREGGNPENRVIKQSKGDRNEEKNVEHRTPNIQ